MIPSLIPNPLFNYHQLFELLLPVTSLLVVAGLLSVFQRATTLPDQLRGIVQVTAIVALLANFDLVVQTSKTQVQQIVEKELKASPEQVLINFAEKLMSSEVTSDDGLWSRITNAGTRLFHALLAALITLVALAAIGFFFQAYLAQELARKWALDFHQSSLASCCCPPPVPLARSSCSTCWRLRFFRWAGARRRSCPII